MSCFSYQVAVLLPSTLEGSFVVFITYRSTLYVCVYRDRISHPVFLAICCVVKLVIFLASMRD